RNVTGVQTCALPILPLGGDLFELLVGLGRIHILLELLRIESELLAEADQRVVVELALRAVLAAFEQSIVVIPVLILLAGGEHGAGGPLGLLAEDGEVAHLDAQVTALD